MEEEKKSEAQTSEVVETGNQPEEVSEETVNGTDHSLSTPPQTSKKGLSDYLTPLAIFAGFGMVAVVLYMNGQTVSVESPGPSAAEEKRSYVEIAVDLGIDESDLEACMQDDAMKDLIEADMLAARDLGAQGTPFSVIVFDDGVKAQVPGALPYQQWQSILSREAEVVPPASDMSPMRDSNRLVYGNPDAATVIVEFSDFECPYCARVHPTIKRLVDESNGTISWEYRHLPLQIHRTAAQAALVSDCTAKLGSIEQFWSFTNEVFGT